MNLRAKPMTRVNDGSRVPPPWEGGGWDRGGGTQGSRLWKLEQR